MGNSIQDYLKKINSRLTWLNCLSFLATSLFLILFVVFIYIQKENKNTSVEYIVFKGEIVNNIGNIVYGETKPFASINGKTYTFSWCQGASMISEKNKIYFNTENEAKNSGRTLSKLCKK